ncbi:hypothetical protein IG631_02484 [Alternaria alternata]|nr:hypothetical protein IG631_02484 [Alternaria alternata]
MQDDEERYADGFAEYGSYFGGPSFDYLLPAQPTSSAIARASNEHALCSDTDPYKPAYTAPGYREKDGNLPSTSYPTPQIAPSPLNYRQRAQSRDPATNEFSQLPISPGAQASKAHTSQDKAESSQPQPLRFLKRASTAPPTPPMSWGSSASNGDGLSDRMQSIYIASEHPRASNPAPEPLRIAHGTFGHVTTTSNTSSTRSSSIISSPMQGLPGSPFQLSQRGFSIPTMQSTESEATEMNPSEAQAEILRRISRRNDASSQTGLSSFKKSFSLKRAATSAKPASGPSQDTLTDVLEEVAAEGSLSLVKAVIGMGADPIYRSIGKLKRLKHEALAKATLSGRAKVVDYLLREGATYGETAKRSDYTPMDRAMLAAAYKGHADLINCLVASHGANPMVEQWPREMYDAQHYWAENQVRLAKTSLLDGLSKWKNVDQGTNTLKLIMQHEKFDPTALISGVFDNKSELQSAEFGHRPWQTTYEYSVLTCFVRAGWADAVEEMLSIKGKPKHYEKEDDILQYQGKVTRYVSPINALTKETWSKRPEDALRILRLLIDRGFDLCLAQRTATDLGVRTAIGRAISADAAQGVELILQAQGGLVREDVFFRRNRREINALPLAAALSFNSLEAARVLLRAGAHPRDPAFDDMNVLQFAAYHSSATNSSMLTEMIGLAPELTYDALSFAINGINKDAVRVLLDTISAAARREQIAALPPIHDMLLHCTPPTKLELKTQYLELIDMVVQWDVGYALQCPQLPAILSAVRKDNYIGMEKLLQLGVVDGSSLVLNSRAQPRGELGMWTMLECCELTDRSSEWLGLLRNFGAPLYH